jgi:hypothetical protein
MKICGNCGQRFEEWESEEGFVEELGELFTDESDEDWEGALCPIFREELGMMNLMGFDDDF